MQLTTDKMSTLNTRIEEIIAGLGLLSIKDDERETVTQQLQGLKNRGLGVKLKPLEHYDGKLRPLRSWLTAASLHMENNGITDDKAKIVFIGSHLKDNAWSWFEPFMREFRKRYEAGNRMERSNNEGLKELRGVDESNETSLWRYR